MGCVLGVSLSKKDMAYLRQRTHFEEKAITEWFKKFKEECPSGELTPAKFLAMHQKLFHGEDTKEFCQYVFRVFDADGSGTIDFKEFILAMELTSSGTPEEKLKRAFKMYDIDGNGVLDIDEMTKVIQVFYDMLGSEDKSVRKLVKKQTARERAEAIFRSMHADKTGHLTEKEFLKGCHDDEELSQLLVLEQSFSKLALSML